MVRSHGTELDVLRGMGSPFFAPPWRADEVGRIMGAPVDDSEVRELVVESYVVMAPAALRRTVPTWWTGGMQHTSMTAAEMSGADGLGDWRVVLRTIQADFRAGSFPAAAAFVADIAAAAEAAEHHPDIHVRYPDRVRVVLTTHATGGLTTLDAEVARTISRLASDAGVRAEPPHAQAVEIAIDTVDADRIRPFWAAVLDYREVDGSLVDPLRVGPPVWFQEMAEPRTERSRFHIDVSVPHDVAEARIAAALAAGGRLVTDHFARSWWVLADADGNEACICTWQDR
jgi:4a-hydroxytetrahydrobiopterin dehydratase